MQLLLYGTGILLVATFVLAILVRLVYLLRRKRPERFWRRTLLVHLVLLPVHLFVTMPAVLGWFGSRMVNTRGDERAYAGPRIAADGAWVLQSRESLASEANGEVEVEPALRACAEQSTVWITSSDGLRLRAFLVPPRQPEPRCSVVLVHGLFRGALELEPVGSMFRDLGAEVLLLELRNHGGSDHAPATFGLRESNDVVAAVEWLCARPEHGDRKVVLFGVSLGTAAVALATERLTGLSGLILDAPMNELLPTAHRLFGTASAERRGFGLPQPFRSLLLTGIELWSGFRCAEVRPGRVLRQLPVELPVLLIGAGQDQRMLPEEVRRLYRELPTQPDRKALWILPDAEHGKVWGDDPEGYRQRLADTLDLIDGR